MTVQTTTSRADYTGNGTTTTFAVPFYFLDNTHVKVLRTQVSTGVVTTLALTTDYTVTGAGVIAGGSITCVTAPTSDQKISILRNVPFTQLVDYVENDPFPANTHERALDQLTMETQQLSEAQSRALTLSENSTGVSTLLPTPIAGNILGWNPSATGLQNVDQSGLATLVASGTARADVFTGDGVTTTFTLESNPGSEAALDVSIGGVTQLPGTDYVWASGTLLTFTSAPAAGVKVLVRYWLGLPQGYTDASSVAYTPPGIGAIGTDAQTKLRESVSVKDFGAVGDGVVSDSAAFLAAGNASSSAVVPDGVYRLDSDVTSSCTFLLSPGVSFTGSGKLYAKINRPNVSVYPGRKKTLGDVFKKAQSGSQISFAFYGTSLTYGQDTTATGTGSPINGASQTRSPTPFPEEFVQSVGWALFPGGTVVYNRGFPGDSTIEGLIRWISSSATDVAVIEYAHNDAKNYGGYAHGPVSVADYRTNLTAIIEREIGKGAAVIVLGSPPVSNKDDNELIRGYVQTAKEIASQYGVPFVDTAEIISSVPKKWTDSIHLSATAYKEIGWMLASLFYRRDAAIIRVSADDIFYASDSLGHGGSLFTWSSAKGGETTLIRLTAGQVYAVGVYCEEDIQPVIHSVNSSGVNTSLSAYYSGVAYTGLTHVPSKGIRQKLNAFLLKRGHRTFLIRNEGATDAYIEAVEFKRIDTAVYTFGHATKSAALSGVFQTGRFTGKLTDWCVIADYSRKLSDPCSIEAYVTLHATSLNGIALLKNRQTAGTEFISNDMLVAFRSGTSLILRGYIAGVVVIEQTFTSAFSAGTFTGTLEITLSSGTFSAYVNGTFVGSMSVTQTSGYAALIGYNTGGFACLGLTYTGEEESSY